MNITLRKFNHVKTINIGKLKSFKNSDPNEIGNKLKFYERNNLTDKMAQSNQEINSAKEPNFNLIFGKIILTIQLLI